MAHNPFDAFINSLDFSGFDGPMLETPDDAFVRQDRIDLINRLLSRGALDDLDGSTNEQRAVWRRDGKEAVSFIQRDRLPDGFDPLGPFYMLTIDQLYITCVTAIALGHAHLDIGAADLAADAACQHLRKNMLAGSAPDDGEIACSLNLITTLTMQAGYIYDAIVPDDDRI